MPQTLKILYMPICLHMLFLSLMAIIYSFQALDYECVTLAAHPSILVTLLKNNISYISITDTIVTNNCMLMNKAFAVVIMLASTLIYLHHILFI